MRRKIQFYYTRILPSFIALVSLLTLNSCVNDDFSPQEWAIDPELSFSKSGILFKSTVGADTIAVFTNYEMFEVNSSADWCNFTIDKNRSAICISVEPNFSPAQRSATLSVSVSRGSKILSKDISIVQNGGIWETLGDFSVYWGYEISESQRITVSQILESLVYVEGGKFNMGYDVSGSTVFTTPHDITLTPYYIGKFEITQRQWNTVMANNPSQFRGENLPVENISWADALEFVTRISMLTQLQIRIPTEAQWEYAARGGKYSMLYIYPGSDDYTKVANYNETALDSPLNRTVEGGTKLPNELGLYDMAGNVAEFCSDWYEYNYVGNETKDPTGPSTGSFKVVRGGNITSPFYEYLPIYRAFSNSINKVTPLTGLRIVLIP